MPKKSKTNKRKTTTAKGRQQRRPQPDSVASGSSFVARRSARVMDSFTPDFVRWFEAEIDGSAEDALLCLQLAQVLVGLCSDHDSSTATGLTPSAVEAAIDEIEGAMADSPETLDDVLEAWDLYLHYLDSSGHWSGSPEEYLQVHELIETAGQRAPSLPQVQVPELTDAEEKAGFTELALVQRTGRLLKWLGSGKQVTGTGALRLKDIADAAACVGVQARGDRAAQPTNDPLPGFEDADSGAATDEAVVRTMHEVPVLNSVWAALTATGLITMTTTMARPSEAAKRWFTADTGEKIDIYRRYVTGFLRIVLAREEVFTPILPYVTAMEMAVLVAGTTSEPVPVERLDDSGDTGEELPDMVQALVAAAAQRRLSALAELGIITVTTHYRTCPVVAQCLAAVYADLAADDGEVDFGDADDESVFQLKISLKRAKPPVWRRVLVPATMHLGELHDYIQSSFEWTDSHLHQFIEGPGRGGPTYGPTGNEFAVDDSIEESTVALSRVLSGVGDKLTYIYDFGDHWEHEIRLEEVLDRSDEVLPAYVTGRGTAPAEDSGGVW